MKFFKKKNLLNVLYAVLIALPLFSILGRVLYTQWNQNAKDSYAGLNINNKQVNNITSIDYTTMYYFDSKIVNENANTTGNQLLFQYEIVVNDNYINTTNWDITTSDRIYINNNTNLPIFYSGSTSMGQVGANQRVAFNFYLTTYNPINDNINNYIKTIFKTIGTPQVQSLDNAFDYSISQFVSENDFGKLNFFTWFSDLFLSNNSVNNLYIHFVNWYLNYTLYVSLGYILWLVLMWFVSFIRRLLEKTSTYETGGF